MNVNFMISWKLVVENFEGSGDELDEMNLRKLERKIFLVILKLLCKLSFCVSYFLALLVELE